MVVLSACVGEVVASTAWDGVSAGTLVVSADELVVSVVGLAAVVFWGGENLFLGFGMGLGFLTIPA